MKTVRRGSFLGFVLLCCFSPMLAYDNATDPGVLAVQKALPSVVSITTESTVTVTRDPFVDILKDFRGMYHPNPIMQQIEQKRVGGFGSGVIIDRDGYIVTNQHTIKNREDLVITVMLANGDKFPARIVISDASNDIALLKVDAPYPLPAISIADSDKTWLAQPVVAIGNPFGLENTVTKGILSSKSRNVRSGDMQYEELIQTDAAINPGNSGGALIDFNGTMLGMNVLVLAKSQGISFAIPSNRIFRLLADYLSLEKHKNISFGASFATREDKLIVLDVSPDSPASAFLRPGDVIDSIDGKLFSSAVSASQYLLGNKKAGDDVRVVYRRGGPPVEARIILSPVDFPLAQKMLGIRLVNLTPELAAKLGYESAQGLLVVSIEQDSQPFKIGLRPGMVISKVNHVVVQDTDDFRKAIAGAKPGSMVPVTVVWSRQVGNAPRFVQQTSEATLLVR